MIDHIILYFTMNIMALIIGWLGIFFILTMSWLDSLLIEDTIECPEWDNDNHRVVIYDLKLMSMGYHIPLYNTIPVSEVTHSITESSMFFMMRDSWHLTIYEPKIVLYTESYETNHITYKAIESEGPHYYTDPCGECEMCLGYTINQPKDSDKPYTVGSFYEVNSEDVNTEENVRDHKKAQRRREKYMKQSRMHGKIDNSWKRHTTQEKAYMM